MPALPISQLPDASSLTGSELVPVVQGGVTSQTTITEMVSLASGDSSLTGQSGSTIVLDENSTDIALSGANGSNLSLDDSSGNDLNFTGASGEGINASSGNVTFSSPSGVVSLNGTYVSSSGAIAGYLATGGTLGHNANSTDSYLTIGSSATAITFGSGAVSVTCTAGLSYMIFASLQLELVGATFSSGHTCTLTILDSTPASVTDVVINIPVVTTTTQTLGIFNLAAFVFNPSSSDNTLSLQAQLSGTPSAGHLQAAGSGTWIYAIQC